MTKQAQKKTGKDKKIKAVTELTEKVAKSKSIIFTDFSGLKHKQLEELRKNLKKVNGEYVVTKNRLMLRALGDSGESVKEQLNDATATLFSYNDEVSPLKETLKYFKTANAGKTKGGLLGKTVLSDADVTKLSALPSKEVLLGRLVGQLMAPISGLHHALGWNINKLVWGLQSVKEKKS